jgi:hypothetical protein
MKYMVDMVSPPTPAQADRMVSLGWDYCIAYIGGPRAAARNQWHIIDGQRYPIGDIAETFSGFLPTFNGLTMPWDEPSSLTYQKGLEHGDMANDYTGACGFDSRTPLCLDLEYGTVQANPNGAREYVRGWVEKVNGAGHKAGLYSDLESLSRFQPGVEVDFKWGAAWVRGALQKRDWQAPEGEFDPSSPPPWDVWQFGGGWIAGVSVDYNSASDQFQFATYG